MDMSTLHLCPARLLAVKCYDSMLHFIMKTLTWDDVKFLDDSHPVPGKRHCIEFIVYENCWLGVLMILVQFITIFGPVCLRILNLGEYLTGQMTPSTFFILSSVLQVLNPIKLEISLSLLPDFSYCTSVVIAQ